MTPQRRTSSPAKPAKSSATARAVRGGSPTRRTRPPIGMPGAGPPAKAGAAPNAATPALGSGPVLAASLPADPTLLQRAERLRDDINRSKLTHPDPWSYTAKARAWGERSQALVEAIAAAGQTRDLDARFTTLSAAVEGDSDFQRARQLF